jgi:hypothetical protein
MKLTYSEAMDTWALVDEAEGRLRGVAGGFFAWAPRLAAGEGVRALPLNGKRYPITQPDFCGIRPGLRRVFEAGPAAGRDVAVAAVVGTSLVGRRDPLQSVAGFASATFRDGEWRLGDVLVTPEGSTERSLCDVSPELATLKWIEALDHEQHLGIGDAIILGPPRDPAAFKAEMTLKNQSPRRENARRQRREDS